MSEISSAARLRDEGELSWFGVAAYAAPSVGMGFMWGLLALYFLKFSTDVLLIAPATIGLLFGASRVWDGITDPMVGIWSDRTRSGLGRRRPWMLGACVPIALSFYALWSPPSALGPDALAIWSAVFLFLLYLAITAFNIPHKALGAELEQGHHARTRVFAAAGFGENVGTAIAAASLALLESSELPRATAGLVSASAGLVTIALILICVFGLRERSDYQHRGGNSGAREGLLAVARNKHARILLGVFFFELLGQTGFVSALPYVSDYVLETPGATFQYLAAAMVTTLLSIPLCLPLSRRFGKVNLWRASLSLKLVVFAVFFGVGVGDQMLVLVVSVLYGAAAGCAAVVAPSIKADVVDSDEAATGKRREGLFFATWNMALKAAMGLALALTGLVLSASGFLPNVAQSPAAVLGIRSLASLLPLAFHAAALALLLTFHLTEADHTTLRQKMGTGTISP